MLTVEQINKLISENKTIKFYHDYSWVKLSKQVLREQNNECQICKGKGIYTKAVIVHHVNYLRERPDLAYSRTYIDSLGQQHRQLLAVCHNCHEKIHGRAYKARTGFVNEEKW